MLMKLTVKGQELSVGYKQEGGALTTVPGTPDKASERFARGGIRPCLLAWWNGLNPSPCCGNRVGRFGMSDQGSVIEVEACLVGGTVNRPLLTTVYSTRDSQ